MVYGEGSTQMTTEGAFSEEQEVAYTGQDIRFTVKDDALYAICLGWPRERLTIRSVAPLLYASEIRAVTLLGHEGPLDWHVTPEGLTIQAAAQRPCEHAFAFKTLRGRAF